MTKKLFVLFTILFISLGLVACQDEISDFEKENILNTAINDIAIPEQTTDDVILPSSINIDSYQVDVSWSSNQTSYLSNTGVVNRPSFENGDQTVELVATLTLLGFSINRTFEVLVIALPEEVAETYTLTFQNDGGTDVAPISNLESGDFIDEPTAPTKEGFTFAGWFKDDNYDELWNFQTDTISENTTLYAKWNEESLETYTVTLNTNGGSAIDPVTDLNSGDTMTEPNEPIKEGYEFSGWFIDESLTQPFDFSTQITNHITIYAKWTEVEQTPEGTPITTAEEFHLIASTHSSGDTFYLSNDIDFTGFAWTYVSFNFMGTINGNGKTLSNLTIDAGDRGGIFTRMKNSTIYNLTLDNIHVVSTGRAGILVGEVDGEDVFIHHVRIMNSSVTGNSSNGVGGLIGYTKNGFDVTVHDIIMDRASITNTNKAAGTIIGRTNNGSLGVIQLSNINIKNTDVQATESVGGIYGDVSGLVDLSIEKVVMDVEIQGDKNLGGIIGFTQSISGISIHDVFMTGSIAVTNTNIGHISSGQIISVVENIYAVSFDVTGTINQQTLSESNIIHDLATINQDWWSNHISSIASDTSWVYQDHLYHLTGLSNTPSNHFTVTLVLQHISNMIHFVEANTIMSEPSAPTFTGYQFIGWYEDIELTITYNFDQIVTEDISLYAKWEALPTYTVSIDGVEMTVIEGQFIDQPADPYQVGKQFDGWFVGEVEFDFSTPITQNYIITSLFSDQNQYTITFDSLGGSMIDTIQLYENELISNLAEPSFEGYRFVDWYLDIELTILFDQLFLEDDVTLYAKYAELGDIVFDDLAYTLSGFAQNHVSIPNLQEGDPGYYVVTNELELMQAINAENTSSTTAARIIEIRSDLNLGFHEVVNQYGILKNLEQHAEPKMHPILKQTGVSMVRIQDRDGNTSKYHEGLMIFSKTGHTIKHASFNIKRSNNIIIRNLKFDELWEWDEQTKGDYDSNDWDYFTLEQINGIWFDHVELGKAYDGLIDFKAGTTTINTVVNATFSYMKLVFEPNAFILSQFMYLEENRTSYSYYNQMRIAGMTMEEIMSVNSFQKKGFLLGGSEGRVGNIFTLTIYNSYIKNLQDRFPRLRGGDVHLFNNIYDATDVYETRNFVRDTWPTLFAKSEYNRQLTNQALVTTENGAILMENTIIKGVTQVIKSNQVSSGHPEMTGKYRVIDSLYRLDDYEFIGSSEDIDTPFIRSNSEPILPFSWSTISELPYHQYDLIHVLDLEAYLSEAILGVTDIPFNWLSTDGQPT